MTCRPTVEVDVENLHLEPGMMFEVNHKGGVIIFRLKMDGTPEAFVAGKKLEVRAYTEFYRDEADAG